MTRKIAMNRTAPGYWLARVVAPLGLLLAMAGCGDADGGGVSAPPVATFALSGSVSHLDASGLTIGNGIETVQVPQGASSFAFSKPLANGTGYTVTVATQPTGMNCVVNNGSGSVSGAAVSNVAIACNTVIAQPVTLGVLASDSSYSGGPRVLLPVTQVGTAATTINAILDTGSSGAVLNALDIFPVSMVSASGFVFPAGQTSLTYNGITVTNVVGTRVYGNNTTTLTGNLGFAQITVGSGTRITTARIPIFFVYKRDPSNGSAYFGNIIGVNPGAAAVVIDDPDHSGEFPPCTPQSTTNCGLASPFRYLDYADGIDKGFVLSKVTLTPCNSATVGSCPTSPNLTIGVTASNISAFNTAALQGCVSPVVFGSRESVCPQFIQNVTVSSGTDSFTDSMIFDTGTPSNSLAVPVGMKFATTPIGATVRIATPSGFAYQYNTTSDSYFKTNVIQPPTDGTDQKASISGIGFFTLNSLLVDYSKAVIGWRNGS